MLVPTKHTNFSNSLLGLGGYIIELLKNQPLGIDEIWNMYQKDIQKRDFFKAHTIENIVLSITFLYSIGKVEEKDGKIYLKEFISKSR